MLEYGSCRENGVDYRWRIYRGPSPPGLGHFETGDLYIATGDEKSVWFFREKQGWTLSDPSRDSRNNPVQRYPGSDGGWVADVCLVDENWITMSSWRKIKNKGSDTRAPKKRKYDINGTFIPELAQESIRHMDSSASMGLRGSVIHLERPSQYPYPEPQNPCNSWIVPLFREWHTGPSRLILELIPRGNLFFSILLGVPDAIPRISAQNPKGEACFVVGKAKRLGPPPSNILAFRDLCQPGFTGFSDSITNLVETGIDWPYFNDQLMNLSSGIPLEQGQKLLCAFDIPATCPNGLISCQWSLQPFDTGGRHALGDLANCWTPAGAITLPHMDGIGCGIYNIHWKGRKLWLMWPPTKKNLHLMERSLACSPSQEASLVLASNLEGLEVLFLTEEDAETAFYLYPNTIHCCISLTQCCHVGAPVRSLEFIDKLEVVMDWAMDWIKNRLLTKPMLDTEDKKRHLHYFEEALTTWEQLLKKRTHRGNSTGTYLRLKDILMRAKEAQLNFPPMTT